ncbi:MAG: hypothetical protein ABFR82_06810 [Nitrospirota bacterium]
MNFIRLLPVFISILLLAAHFYRAGLIALVFLVLASPFILLTRKPWAARIIQIELVLGGMEWIRTAINFIQIRQSYNMPWTRLAIILGAVAMCTLVSALVFRSRFLKDRYRIGENISLTD